MPPLKWVFLFRFFNDFGNDFSMILVGLEGQVGWPNRARRVPKHVLMFEKSASEKGYGPSWGAWGPSWVALAVVEPSWGPGGPPGVRRFDGSWGRLGALLGPSWALLAFKIDSGW